MWHNWNLVPENGGVLEGVTIVNRKDVFSLNFVDPSHSDGDVLLGYNHRSGIGCDMAVYRLSGIQEHGASAKGFRQELLFTSYHLDGVLFRDQFSVATKVLLSRNKGIQLAIDRLGKHVGLDLLSLEHFFSVVPDLFLVAKTHLAEENCHQDQNQERFG
jgi:hypothetical protein